ncbi:MAG: PorT family protein [Bacteroidia bacterium]|nr:PorT family protein [Bacteroidia bacterium]
MKKSISIIALFLFSCFVFSDNNPQKKLFFSIVSGPNYSKFYRIINNLDYKYKFGHSTGFSIDYILEESNMLNFKILYEEKGSYINTHTSTDFKRIFYRFDYLNLFLCYRISMNRKNTFFLNGGPYCGQMVFRKSAIYTPEYTQLDFPTRHTAYNFLDFGLNLNLAYRDKLFTNNYFFLESGINVGYNSQIKSFFYHDIDRIKNLSFYILFGISF